MTEKCCMLHLNLLGNSFDAYSLLRMLRPICIRTCSDRKNSLFFFVIPPMKQLLKVDKMVTSRLTVKHTLTIQFLKTNLSALLFFAR